MSNKQINKDMMLEFTQFLDPTTKDFLIMLIPDQKDDSRHPMSWYGTIEDLAPTIWEYNNKKYGAFIAINKTLGKRRRSKDIIQQRAIMHDDDGDGDGKPLPLAPSLVIESGGVTESGRIKMHSYYFPTTDSLSKDDYFGMQHVLIDDYGCDPNVKDLPRLMRLPGTWHWKTGKPKHVRIVKKGNKYTRDELLVAFPPKPIATKTGKSSVTHNLTYGSKAIAQENISLNN